MNKKHIEIAELLGRSRKSIAARLSVICVEPNKKRWTDEEKEEVRKLIKSGFTTKQIAKKLKRTNDSVEMCRTRYINRESVTY